MIDAECESLKELAKEILRNRDAARRVKAVIERAVSDNTQMVPLANAVGKVTAAVLFVALGDPRNYESAAAYVKAAGLNLKERSSGKHQGKLKITKRGPSVARRYLYLAALRLICSCPICRAWYHK